jgi:hypothetical protein
MSKLSLIKLTLIKHSIIKYIIKFGPYDSNLAEKELSHFFNTALLR